MKLYRKEYTNCRSSLYITSDWYRNFWSAKSWQISWLEKSREYRPQIIAAKVTISEWIKGEPDETTK